ncbi:hypothetical protein [Malonomonas rubra]|uniref:hypothetical protein n=1 Tax=Malonomonas rubra TaxID=57040 RepID=UPI0026EF83D2|nr:hypothetical protein [Malonomonas rubra]
MFARCSNNRNCPATNSQATLASSFASSTSCFVNANWLTHADLFIRLIEVEKGVVEHLLQTVFFRNRVADIGNHPF